MSEWAQFTTLEHDGRSYTPEDVPGDGNCFYHCAIRSTAIPYVDVGDLRRDVCAFALGAGRPAAERAIQLLGYKAVDENGKSSSLSFADAVAHMSCSGVQVTNVEMILVRLLFNVNVVSLSNYAIGIEAFSADEFCAKHLKMYVPFGPAPRSMVVFRHVLSQPMSPVPRSDDDQLNHYALLWPATATATATRTTSATPTPIMTMPTTPVQPSTMPSNNDGDVTAQVAELTAEPKTSPNTTPAKRKRASKTTDTDVTPVTEAVTKPTAEAAAAAEAPTKRTHVTKSQSEKEVSEPAETLKMRTTSRQAALQKKKDLEAPTASVTEPVDNSSTEDEEPEASATESGRAKKRQSKQQKQPKPRKTTIVKKQKTVWAPGTKPKEQTWERRALLVAFHLHDDLGARDFSVFTSVFGETVSPETLRNWLRKENVCKWMPIVKDVTKRDLVMGVVPEDKRSLFEKNGSDDAIVSQKALSKYIAFEERFAEKTSTGSSSSSSETAAQEASSSMIIKPMVNASISKRAHRLATSGKLGRPVKHAVQEKFASDTIKAGFENGSPVFFNEVLSAVRTAFSDKEKFASFQKVLESDKQIRTWLRRVFQRMDVSEHERMSRMMR